MSAAIRIGTRGSALALAQAGWVQTQLLRVHPGVDVVLVTIKTSGDRFVDRPLRDIGGKGLFVKEIEDALLTGTIDCAVHSMKDLPAAIAPGLSIAAIPEREDPRDVLVARLGGSLAQLPRAAAVGTSSLRRAALLRHARPDLVIKPLRGNVDTRLRHLREPSSLDAIVLAAAGLRRLALTPDGTQLLDVDEFIPAIGQGALAIQTRDNATGIVAALDHATTRGAIAAERAFMVAVGGSCHTPLAAHATVADGQLEVRAFIASPDGSRMVRGTRGGPVAEAEGLGGGLAAELLNCGGAAILAALDGELDSASPGTGHGR